MTGWLITRLDAQGQVVARVLLDPDAERESGPWSVGRSPLSKIRLDDPTVSRDHGVFMVRGRRLYITDRPTSTNGIRVNGHWLPKGGSRWLQFGDRITLGQTTLAVAPPEGLRTSFSRANHPP